MKINEASWDRIIRVVLGVVLLYLAIAGVVGGGLAIVLGVIGAILLLTGIIGFCPIYALIGMATKKS